MTSTQNSNCSLTRRAAITLCLATSLFFAFRAASPNAQAVNSANVVHDDQLQVNAEKLVDRANVSASTVETEQLITQNIEDIRLGQRVVGTNPLREQTQPASDIQPETWRAVRLNMIQGGVEYDLAFLRSLSWIEATGAQVGHSIHMELHEIGLDGPAQVVAIEPCPEIEPDDGTGRNLVTGTMAHPGDNILYLDITGLDEPLGVTDTHPIWSETRQDFVLAGQLEVGEQFRTLTGESATLTKIHPHRGPPQIVFNLEVDGQHVYSVAGSGLLVHNTCPDAETLFNPLLRSSPAVGGTLPPGELVAGFISNEGDMLVQKLVRAGTHHKQIAEASNISNLAGRIRSGSVVPFTIGKRSTGQIDVFGSGGYGTTVPDSIEEILRRIFN